MSLHWSILRKEYPSELLIPKYSEDLFIHDYLCLLSVYI
jgi:hypothetical protein